jgi:hypothetical protein
MGEALVQGNGREGDGQGAREEDAALDVLDQPGDVPMAWVVAGRGVDDADYGTVKCFVGVACALDESLAKKERELVVATVSNTQPSILHISRVLVDSPY